MKRRGLTLIEAMVLLAVVVVVLVVIVWPPTMVHPLKEARKSACQANLKVFGAAFREYERSVGGFPRVHLVADAGGALATSSVTTLSRLLSLMLLRSRPNLAPLRPSTTQTSCARWPWARCVRTRSSVAT